MAKKHKDPICPYCKTKAQWVSHSEIYNGKVFNEKAHMIWLCKPCDAYVGCHQNTKQPLGTIVNAATRRARKLTKEAFIKNYLRGNWNCKPVMKNMAYETLAERMGISKKKCHFAMFDIETCRKAWKVIYNLKEKS